MEAVIFDFNGTLFFDNDKHLLAWGAVSKALRGQDLSEAELETHLNGVPNREIIQYLTNHQASLDEIKQWSLEKEVYYRQFCLADKENFHLVAGVEAYFNYLQDSGIPFTIASASIKPNIDFFVESFHLDHWIKKEKIVYDDGTYQNKVKMFLKAAEILKTPIEKIVIFEDSPSGVANAYRAGCHQIVVVCPKAKSQAFLKMPGVIQTIETFEEMLDLK